MRKKTIYLGSCKKIGVNGIDIASKYLEQVRSYKFCGLIVNGNNSIEE
jgi:hypothetical protein